MTGPFEHARKNANPDCLVCHGTGTYMYDKDHGTICPRCCKHDMGWWQLTEAYGDAGKWCCKAGCGKTVDSQPLACEAIRP